MEAGTGGEVAVRADRERPQGRVKFQPQVYPGSTSYTPNPLQSFVLEPQMLSAMPWLCSCEYGTHKTFKVASSFNPRCARFSVRRLAFSV